MAAGFLAWQVSRLKGTVDAFKTLIEQLSERVGQAETLNEKRNSDVHERIDTVQHDQLAFCENRWQILLKKITNGGR